jgi:hypothetical protein
VSKFGSLRTKRKSSLRSKERPYLAHLEKIAWAVRDQDQY